MGLEIGDPKCPIPVLNTRLKGFCESLGRYAIFREGPESKKVPRFRDSSFDSPATIPDWNGNPRMLRGTLARKSGFLSSRNLIEAFIFNQSHTNPIRFERDSEWGSDLIWVLVVNLYSSAMKFEI